MCLMGGPVGAAQPENRVLDGVAAVVNDGFVTVGDVMKVVSVLDRQLRALYRDDRAALVGKLQEAYATTLDSLLEQQLVLDAFEQAEIPVSDRFVQQQVAEIVRNRFDGDQGRLLEALAAERLTMDEWEDRMREQMMVSLMIRREVRSKVRIKPGAVRARYRKRPESFKIAPEAKLWMIVIPGAGETGEKAAQAAHDRLMAGEPFAKVARDVSKGPKAPDGGNWGWVEIEKLKPELAERILALDPGEISDVLELDGNHHIVRVEAARDGGVMPFGDAIVKIERILEQAEYERLYAEWMSRLKTKSFVRVF